MKKQKGFSLIELLIVVAIILIIAAIAVPNLLRSRMAANESSAAGSLRTIATSNVTYSTTYNIGYAQELSKLGPGAGGAASVIPSRPQAASRATTPMTGASLIMVFMGLLRETNEIMTTKRQGPRPVPGAGLYSHATRELTLSDNSSFLRYARNAVPCDLSAWCSRYARDAVPRDLSA